VTGLTQSLAATTKDQTLGFFYTPASQISQRTASNDLYNWSPANLTRTYTPNGRNQYTAISGATITHDARGNLTSDGSRSFTYDLENRLLSVSGSASLSLAYDPLGRLRSTTAGGTTTEFLYDGDALVGEYVGRALARRYAHGAGVDEPLVWYEGRRWLVSDHQGTIIAHTDAAGTTSRYAYGPYGEPDSWGTQSTHPRFRYTGQAALPEAQLYHYKARVYDPLLGRFLQTDPIGYEDDLNLYAYVRNDPLRGVDPTGTIKLSIGLEGEITAGLGLGAGASVSVSFPLPFVDPQAEFDLGATLHGSARAGVMVGGGVTGAVEMGSIRDAPTFDASFDVIAGPPTVQVAATAPARVDENGRIREPGAAEPSASGARPRAGNTTVGRARVGVSTGGLSEGVRGSWTGSLRRGVQAASELIRPRVEKDDDKPSSFRVAKRNDEGSCCDTEKSG
jgi:RHS repeat-associated protein